MLTSTWDFVPCDRIVQKAYSLLDVHTPNANMADRSVGARHESHESEASQSSMFCCDNVLLCRRSGLLCFAVATSCCVSERHEKGYKSSTVRLLSSGKVNVSAQFVETKERSSCSPRELKFVRYISHYKILENSFLKLTSLCDVWWCFNTISMASTFPKVKRSSS